ncbi:MAG TPA: hypothetical protein DIU07_07335 [Rhodobacteraceae bacterium]|mgnify:CR=1 FL=1|nr:hypothetical protein [Paracoccaceae bacterium]
MRDRFKPNAGRWDQNPTACNTLTIHVPFRVVKCGGRKAVQLPDGVEHKRRVENTMVKALARAFRWKRMLEAGEFTTIAELAEHERIAPSYMTRILRLTLLAPDIVEEILDGRQGPEVTLKRMLGPLPMDWAGQADHFGWEPGTGRSSAHGN